MGNFFSMFFFFAPVFMKIPPFSFYNDKLMKDVRDTYGKCSLHSCIKQLKK